MSFPVDLVYVFTFRGPATHFVGLISSRCVGYTKYRPETIIKVIENGLIILSIRTIILMLYNRPDCAWASLVPLLVRFFNPAIRGIVWPAGAHYPVVVLLYLILPGAPDS